MADDEYEKMSEAMLTETIARQPGGVGSESYRRALTEILRRKEIKEKENKKEQTEIKNDQRQIKIMTAVILALTVIILGYTVAQYFK